MLWLTPARLRQLGVVVTDVKPQHFPVLDGIDQLVGQVLIDGVLSHLDSGTSDYSRIVRAQSRLHPEKLQEQNLVGFDTHEGFAEMHKNRGVEDSIGVEIEILNAIVPEHPFEEIADQ
jgi:hypothetical protein